MATEIERLEAIIKAGVATNEDKARLAELQAAPATAIDTAPATATTAPAGKVLVFEDDVDIDSFNKGGDQYYMPSQEGFFRSKLVEANKPTYTEKDMRWFVFETDDPKLKAQGRGAIVVEMAKGAFQLKNVLSGLGIPYIVESSLVKYSISFPFPCYADWSRDAKGVGEVRVSGLRTAEAGASVEIAI